ncbi:MAG TPA: hypothetical protein PLS90_10245 [Candidatus Sumerlaeota bacterium]|nr:hypothetical protein [Candidatus Sumerlaeota bacterium]HOR26679.1 hypothetical protein [Candidatus Sumerlaeota bacterium]HPK02822.1 hypothetical protein [Candidatus Sumerlaeota bacterium]
MDSLPEISPHTLAHGDAVGHPKRFRRFRPRRVSDTMDDMPHCAYCHQPIPANVHPYTLRLELFPAVEPSLQIREEDLKLDFEAEMRRLIRIMEQMDEAQVVEQEQRMFLSRSFTLCPACRDRLARQLESLKPGEPA